MLTMQGIRKSFAGNEVLHGVDFTVERGQVHALIGHNGAGKSTLMRVLGGSYPDYKGTVTIDGEERNPRTPRDSLQAGIAIIYQDFALVPDLDVAHNIALGREPGPRGLVAHRRLRRRSKEEATRFGIALPMDTAVRQLGVAEQQLTEIVRALARDVRYLVMDEPTARLAPAERRQLFRIIRSLASSGVGVVYISHFLEEVIEIADVVTVLRDGSVVGNRPASECTADGLALELVGDSELPLRSSARVPAGRRVHDGGPVRLSVKGLESRRGRSVDLEVPAGQIVAVAGLVGSGRTSLARALIGDRKVPGSVCVDGRLVDHRNPRAAARAGLILVPEDRKRAGLVLTSSIRANVELTALGTDVGLTRGGLVRRRRIDILVRDLIQQLGVRPPRPSMLAGSLSGGNAQKVVVARAIAAAPKVVVLDQPTAGVDVGAKAELHAQILALADAGAAVIVVSDDLDEMLELADRVVVMTGGLLTQDRPAASFDRAELLAAMSRTEAA